MASKRFIPKGAASLKVDYDGPPKDFYFLLLPNMTLLAFSAAVEPLRVANQVANKQLYRWFTMTEDGAPMTCSNYVTITPDRALEPVPKEALSFICAGNDTVAAAGEKTIHWLNRQRAFGSTVGGICTGAFALAKAGLLTNRKFTLHWENQPSFCELYPNLEPTPNLYENDDGLLTCGGGNAATDMMLELIEGEHGKDLAIIVADMCIHTRSHNQAAPQKSTYSVALGSRNQRLITAMQFMQENLEEPIDISELADHVQTSRRQLERLFKRYVNMTPNQFYYDLRISRAHALLNETNLSVTEIAMATGFNTTAQLAKRFKAKYGTSPHLFRKGWGSGLQ
jgi:AraC family transcriptional regulator, carnitine catabolism transcriptional activator